MGAKNWMLAYADGDPAEILRSSPMLMREQAREMAAKFFPLERLEQLEDGALGLMCPPEKELLVGCYPGLSVASASEFAGDYPSKLSAALLGAVRSRRVVLHAVHSVVDWLAFAVWEDGKLRRSLSVAPDSGVLEDIGERYPFEEGYWSGQFPVGDDEEAEYPLPFHPLELSDAVLMEFFGYTLEGTATSIDPYTIPVLRFKRVKAMSPKRWFGFLRR